MSIYLIWGIFCAGFSCMMAASLEKETNFERIMWGIAVGCVLFSGVLLAARVGDALLGALA